MRKQAERYEGTIPDTLDLVERGELAINPLTSFADEKNDYRVWWSGHLEKNPVRMSRLIPLPLYAKFVEGLFLLRIMSGSKFNNHVDAVWKQKLIEVYQVDKPPVFHGDDARNLVALGILAYLEPKGPWLEIGRNAVNHTLSSIIDKGEWGYLEWPQDEYDAPPGIDLPDNFRATWQGWTLQGLAQFYRLTGYEPALKGARKLAYFIKDHAGIFSPEGEFLAGHGGYKGIVIHFHHNGNSMQGLSEYALVSGDREVSGFALKCYKYARSLGEPQADFFPEYVTWPDVRAIYNSEGCCVVDMVLTSLNLSLMGVADLWDDLDRYIRNMFSEMQMLDAQWLTEYSSNINPTEVDRDEFADNVPQKLVGDFAGWMPFNEFGGGVQHCCLGNCAKAIYHIWLNCVHFNEGTLRVNLLINHESCWATVKSMIPYRGYVEIMPRQKCKLIVRLPEYVKPEEVKISVDDKKMEPELQERLAIIDEVDANALVTINFPIPLWKKKVTIPTPYAAVRLEETYTGKPVDYTLTIKGNVVVDCQPRGKRYPFYVHPEYMQEQIPLKTVKRVIPSQMPFLE